MSTPHSIVTIVNTGCNPKVQYLSPWGNMWEVKPVSETENCQSQGLSVVLAVRGGLGTRPGGCSRTPVHLTWLGASGGMGDGDLDWKASWDMNPESWEDTLDSRTGACWARLELRQR